jgi:hypothetical protein
MKFRDLGKTFTMRISLSATARLGIMTTLTLMLLFVITCAPAFADGFGAWPGSNGVSSSVGGSADEGCWFTLGGTWLHNCSSALPFEIMGTGVDLAATGVKDCSPGSCNWSFYDDQWLAEQFTLDAASDIDFVSAGIQWGSVGINYDLMIKDSLVGGTTFWSVSTDLSDPSFTPTPFTLGAGTYYLVGQTEIASSVPEPATFLLLGTGLAGLVAVRRKVRK